MTFLKSLNGFETMLLIGAVLILFVAFVSTLADKGKSAENDFPKISIPVTIESKEGKASEKCYLIFKPEMGEKIKLQVPEKDFSLLAAGDRGLLTFQGSSYLEFQRKQGGKK